MIISRIVIHQPVGLLRLLTDTGLEGRCTGAAVTVAETDIAAAASILINANPIDRERIWLAFNEVEGRGAFRTAYLYRRRIVGPHGQGRQPAGHRHVNGFRNRIPVCRRGAERNSAAEIVEEAKEALRAGFGGTNSTPFWTKNRSST